jgi:hypothetical protein
VSVRQHTLREGWSGTDLAPLVGSM